MSVCIRSQTDPRDFFVCKQKLLFGRHKPIMPRTSAKRKNHDDDVVFLRHTVPIKDDDDDVVYVRTSPRKKKVKSPEPCRIRFYDDDPRNIDAVNAAYPGVIESILVPRHALGVGDYYNYIETTGGWDLDGADVDLRAVLVFLRQRNVQERVVVHALTLAHFDSIRAWAGALPPPSGGRITRGKVFFDWDQVVSHLEGYVAPLQVDQLHANGLTASGYMKLCMGTRQRMDAFRGLVDYLIGRNVEVHIVTNNGGCSNTDDQPTFRYIANSLDPRLQVSCCRTYASKGICIQARNISHLAFGRRVLSFGSFKRRYKKHISSNKLLHKFQKGLRSII
jgi:hypothetical protein